MATILRMTAQTYDKIRAALHYLDRQRDTQPALSDVAAHLNMSEFHFQRLFTEWVGISPKQFLQFLNREYLKNRLDESATTLAATFDAGLSSTSRSHELFVKTEGITPAEYRSLGKNLVIHYGIHESPFGRYLLAITDRGICHMAFIDENTSATLDRFRLDWSEALLLEDDIFTAPFAEQIFTDEHRKTPSLLLRGTPFQLKVWEALISIPEGEVCSYEQLALLTGMPSATRACASAIARNRVALLIPCHRVIRKIGESGEYRWGKERKRLMLGWEAAKCNEQPEL